MAERSACAAGAENGGRGAAVRKGRGPNPKPVGEFLESLTGDILKQLVAAGKMTIGRGGADTGKARGLGQRKGLGAVFLDQADGCLDQGLAQVAMVI